MYSVCLRKVAIESNDFKLMGSSFQMGTSIAKVPFEHVKLNLRNNKWGCEINDMSCLAYSKDAGY